MHCAIEMNSYFLKIKTSYNFLLTDRCFWNHRDTFAESVKSYIADQHKKQGYRRACLMPMGD